ncbi:MAG: 5-(carboxyamino)imidazole ribonucleotide synthase [Phycisphaerales bacterium]
MIPQHSDTHSGPRIGVLGGGQLGRMLALAGLPLGARFTFLDPSPEACSRDLGPLITAGYDDRRALAKLAESSDIVTYEFENVPSDAVRWLAQRVPVLPSPEALDASQDRLTEKRFFELLGAATPRYAHVDVRQDLTDAIKHLGLPAVMKTRRMGYDGRGQWILRKNEDAEEAVTQLGGWGMVLEEFVKFDREVSIVAARARTGEIAFLPLVQNIHDGGILRETIVPAPNTSPKVEEEARRIAKASLETLEYVGVIAIEFFQVGDRLLVNEMAPRVHNTGHWSIDGARVSQYDQHLRAILGLPLGDSSARGRSVMLNFIGGVPKASDLLAIPGVYVHDYGKSPRPGRKVGHVTVLELERGDQTFDERVGRARQIVDAAWRR